MYHTSTKNTGKKSITAHRQRRWGFRRNHRSQNTKIPSSSSSSPFAGLAVWKKKDGGGRRRSTRKVMPRETRWCLDPLCFRTNVHIRKRQRKSARTPYKLFLLFDSIHKLREGTDWKKKGEEKEVCAYVKTSSSNGCGCCLQLCVCLIRSRERKRRKREREREKKRERERERRGCRENFVSHAKGKG